MIKRSYSDLIQFSSFEDRFRYLKLRGDIGQSTFGFDRYLNQKFYKSIEWKRIRDFVIVRDQGCDLGCIDKPIFGKILVHHMNPVLIEDLKNDRIDILNPDYLISVSMDTHNAIHYGDEKIFNKYSFRERTRNDTILWRNK